MNLDEQMRIFAKYKSLAQQVALGELECRGERLLAMAEARLKAGFATYADATWKKTSDELEEELLEELADAIVYAAILLWREKETP